MGYSFAYQRRGGVTRTMHVDSADEFTVQTTVPLDEILAGIERDRELHPTTGANKLLARVPMHIYEKSLLEKWDEDDWKRWLNDSDNEPFRVWKGRV